MPYIIHPEKVKNLTYFKRISNKIAAFDNSSGQLNKIGSMLLSGMFNITLPVIIAYPAYHALFLGKGLLFLIPQHSKPGGARFISVGTVLLLSSWAFVLGGIFIFTSIYLFYKGVKRGQIDE